MTATPPTSTGSDISDVSVLIVNDTDAQRFALRAVLQPVLRAILVEVVEAVAGRDEQWVDRLDPLAVDAQRDLAQEVPVVRAVVRESFF